MSIDTTLAIVSLTATKTYLRITADDDDDAVGDVINRVSSEISEYCGRIFLYDSFTEYYDGNGSDNLWVKNPPINNTASTTYVYIDLERNFESSSRVATAYLIVDQTKGLITLDGDLFIPGKQNVKVVYNGGYTGYSTIPKSIESAAFELIAHYWFRGQQANVGTLSKNKGDTSKSYRRAAEEKADIMKPLDFYIRYISGCG